MSKIKVNVDREPISSSSIADRQDFNHVLSEYRKSAIPSFNSKWVLGSVISTAVITGVIVSASFDWDSGASDQKSSRRDLLSEVCKPSSLEQIASREQFEKSPAVAISRVDEQSRTKQNRKNEEVEQTAKPESKVNGEKEVQVIPVSTKDKAEPQHEPKPTSSTPMPHIGNYYTGEIPINVLCNNEQIASGSNLAVVAYQITYFDGNKEVSQTIKGAAIPNAVCDKLGRYNLGENVRITSIVGEDRSTGQQYQLPSMHITPIDSSQ